MRSQYKLYDKKLLSKEDVILHSLKEFYSNLSHIEKMIPIVTGKTKLSLRVLDWFVTNYAKKYDISYKIKKNSKLVLFNVYHDYKNKLKSYNKRFFDPFCRKNKKNLTNKIAFKYNDDNYIITTIGQLNFFRWAIRCNIIDYVITNYDVINLDMNTNNKKNKKNKKNKDESKKIQKYTMNTTINFNSNPMLNSKLKLNSIGTEDSISQIAKLEFK